MGGSRPWKRGASYPLKKTPGCWTSYNLPEVSEGKYGLKSSSNCVSKFPVTHMHILIQPTQMPIAGHAQFGLNQSCATTQQARCTCSHLLTRLCFCHTRRGRTTTIKSEQVTWIQMMVNSHSGKPTINYGSIGSAVDPLLSLLRIRWRSWLDGHRRKPASRS